MEAIEDALRLLRALHRERNRVPVQDTVQALLRATRAHAGLALRRAASRRWPTSASGGARAAVRVDEGASFRGFVQQSSMRPTRKRPRVRSSRRQRRGSSDDRAQGKGLEFPVVILADTRVVFIGSSVAGPRRVAWPVRADDRRCTPMELVELRDVEAARDRAEGHRLAYVAATRARDLLVVPGVGDEPYPHAKQGEKWIDVMNRALYPARPGRPRRQPSGAPSSAANTVLERPDEEAAMYVTPLRPGRYEIGGGEAPFAVTWWDPSRLHLGAEPSLGARQKALIDRHAPESRVREGHEAVDLWTQVHVSRLASGRTPSLRVQRVTDAAHDLDLSASSVAVLQVPATGSRRGGRAFGALVHEVLAVIGLDATEQDIATAAAFKARVSATRA